MNTKQNQQTLWETVRVSAKAAESITIQNERKLFQRITVSNAGILNVLKIVMINNDFLKHKQVKIKVNSRRFTHA